LDWKSNMAKKCIDRLRASLGKPLLAACVLMAGLLPVALAADAATSEPAARSAPAKKVVGYYIGWAREARNFPPEKIDARSLTHINYAFANVAQGRVVLGDPVTDKANLADLRALKAVNPQLKILVSVGGWNWSKHFSDVALTTKSRQLFANSAVDYVQTHRIDGVDLDWEFPVAGGDAGNSARPEDKQNFTLLLRAVRHALDGAGKRRGVRYLLTIASSPGPDFVKNTELSAVAQTVDWINIMGYDFHGTFGKRSGPNAPLYADPTDDANPVPSVRHVSGGVEGHIAAGVPRSKIVLGIPFYGYVWRGCAPINNGQYQTCAGPAKGTWEDGSLEYSDIVSNYLTQPGFSRHWNDATKTPSLWNPTGGIFITYDDAESIGYKLDFIEQQRLGGAMVWELTTDRERSLLTPIARRLLPTWAR
jgi:chitinase